MNWSTQSHIFTATVCQHTGAPCPALARLARVVARALETAAPVTQADFEIEGSSELTHCADGCMAAFRATHQMIRIFCGAQAGASCERMDRYADMIFSGHDGPLPSGTLAHPPCAMLQAQPRSTQKPVEIAAAPPP